MDRDWINKMIALGIISYDEQETLFQIAKKCAVRAGIPTGAGIAYFGAPGGPVGVAEAFLAGLLAGTVVCTTANLSLRQQLKQMAQDN